MPDSVTITDNRTGESVEVPIVNGGVDANAWKQLMPGTWFLDPGFSVTASAESAITELDGGQGFRPIGFARNRNDAHPVNRNRARAVGR